MSKLQTLAKDLGLDLKRLSEQDKLNAILNQNPPEKWCKVNKYANNTKYLPIDKIEDLLTQVFQFWRVEVLSYSNLFNSVAVHIRLHYQSPISGEWLYQDGVGAVGIQLNQGSQAFDLAQIKTDSIMKALPAAKSYAIKDAADHLGRLFGRDLNRIDTLPYQPTYSFWEEKIKKENDTTKN